MESIFKDLPYNYVTVYLNDNNVYYCFFSNHIIHFNEVIKRIRKAKLNVNKKKMSPFIQLLQLLDHVVTDHLNNEDPEKMVSINAYKLLL